MKTIIIKDADYWINNLKMEPHPEGGYFNQTYQSKEIIPADVLPFPRAVRTGHISGHAVFG